MSKHQTLSDEVMAIQLEAAINNGSYPKTPDATTVKINGTEWVFHQLVKPHSRSRT